MCLLDIPPRRPDLGTKPFDVVPSLSEWEMCGLTGSFTAQAAAIRKSLAAFNIWRCCLTSRGNLIEEIRIVIPLDYFHYGISFAGRMASLIMNR